MIYVLLISAGLHALAFFIFGIASVSDSKKKSVAQPAFSVIVCAHNEEENIEKLIPLILEQNYADFEFILVLDRCTDTSKKIAEEFSKGITQIKIIEINETPAGYSPKKWAVTQGIESSKNEWLAFTDADCRPGKNWLSSLASQADDSKTSFIIGQSPYFSRPGLLNLFIRFETLLTAVLYSGAAKIGFPWMAVGRNLAYKKSEFTKAEGFGIHSKVLSGDDDLFINRNANKSNTRIISQKESLVFSEPVKSMGGWLRQKTRHVSASGHYSLGTKAFLGVYQCAQIVFYLSLTLCILWGGLTWPLMVIAGGRWLIEGIAIFPQAIRWKQIELVIFYPFLDALFCFYNLLVVPAGWLVKPGWKKI